jgi:hypothetical protein
VVIIALLLGLYLGAKCHAPLNILLKVLHDKFGRYEGLMWYGFLTTLLYEWTGVGGLVVALALPAVYIAWQFAPKVNWHDLAAKHEAEEAARYAPGPTDVVETVPISSVRLPPATTQPGARLAPDPQDDAIDSATPRPPRRSRTRATGSGDA